MYLKDEIQERKHYQILIKNYKNKGVIYYE